MDSYHEMLKKCNTLIFDEEIFVAILIQVCEIVMHARKEKADDFWLIQVRKRESRSISIYD